MIEGKDERFLRDAIEKREISFHPAHRFHNGIPNIRLVLAEFRLGRPFINSHRPKDFWDGWEMDSYFMAYYDLNLYLGYQKSGDLFLRNQRNGHRSIMANDLRKKLGMKESA